MLKVRLIVLRVGVIVEYCGHVTKPSGSKSHLLFMEPWAAARKF